MAELNVRELSFSYLPGITDDVLKNISVSVEKGEWIALIGRNGSGKSTFLRSVNALLPLQKGSLRIGEMDVSSGDPYQIRRRAGMVFQNPDNQFVSSLVREDIAFGPENYEFPLEDIPGIVKDALSEVHMEGYEDRAPYTLSGGQKQRIALAGILAIRPSLLLFDEVTSMLDPEGRQEVLSAIRELHAKGHTILMVTHFIEEAALADRILLFRNGEILRDGSPRELLSDLPLLEEAGMLPPHVTELASQLRTEGFFDGELPLTPEEFVEGLCPSN